jgi:hypothetical protein
VKSAGTVCEALMLSEGPDTPLQLSTLITFGLRTAASYFLQERRKMGKIANYLLRAFPGFPSFVCPRISFLEVCFLSVSLDLLALMIVPDRWNCNPRVQKFRNI